MLSRIGSFFWWVGLFLILLFVTTDLREQPEFNFLLLGLVLMALGFFLWRRYHQPPEPSNRFSLIRRLLSRNSSKDKDGE
ncbi:MAG: LPXTG cell wall anchor domain-containing protein [Chloroflexi bacterium]|nr:MAG: LPXTG cell wall anchor domain-containing protein [Chloroflexota bacterium]MBL1197099.1 LPXTG cell wall anchor domain-containing protein [Chloroflexota bacterium]